LIVMGNSPPQGEREFHARAREPLAVYHTTLGPQAP
jgi:hypothetical protein